MYSQSVYFKSSCKLRSPTRCHLLGLYRFYYKRKSEQESLVKY